MAATMQDLKRWFENGRKVKATHMIVVCDTFDHEDFPVFVAEGEDARKKAAEFTAEHMERVMEVYSLSRSFESQSTGRVFNYD